jgi:hypothetical protein
MKNLSLKGIGAGVLAAIVLTIPIALMSHYHFKAIYNDVAHGVNFENEAVVQEIIYKLIFHPLSIVYAILASIVTVGIPGYIAAFIAKKAFVLNSLAVGLIGLLVCLLEIDFIIQFPILFVLVSLFTLAVAYLAGSLRHRQVKKNLIWEKGSHLNY